MKRFKKFFVLIMIFTMILSMAACGTKSDGDSSAQKTESGQSDKETNKETNKEINKETESNKSEADQISDTMTSEDNKYVVAMVTDVAQLKDKSFNQGTWDGVKSYAYKNKLSYKYYQPAGGSEATDTDRYDAFISAINNGAEIIVAPGFLQAAAIEKVAKEHPDVKIVFIDGGDLGLDNVVGISYHEDQSGFLAGYATVKDGFTKLGFTGGGGGSNDAVSRCGYGFAQGASAAAQELNVDVELNYSYLYGDSYSASDALQTQINGWYSAGTEVVLAYGGTMCNSVFAAASANNAYSIGGDVDQSGDSDTVLTSAMKGLGVSVEFALDKFYSGNWDDIKGAAQMGIEEDSVGLPIKTSRFETFTEEDYNTLVEKLKKGEYSASADFKAFAAGEEELPNVKVNFIK